MLSWDTAFDKRLDDLEAGHGLLACGFGQHRQQWARSCGAAGRRVWAQGVGLRMRHHGSTGAGKKTRVFVPDLPPALFLLPSLQNSG